MFSAVSLPTMQGASLGPLFSSSLSSTSAAISLMPRRRGDGFVVSASMETGNLPLTGVVFQPFEEVKKEALMVPISPQLSLARQRFLEECEAAINEQINVEYNVSYVYHSMYAYFDRDNIALKGLAKFFKESSEEEREHAEKLMKYQNIRGGRVKLHSILMPLSEFDHVEKGDALYAMELALSLEKLTNEKLLSLHSVADRNNDAQMSDFVETEFLTEQVNLQHQVLLLSWFNTHYSFGMGKGNQRAKEAIFLWPTDTDFVIQNGLKNIASSLLVFSKTFCAETHFMKTTVFLFIYCLTCLEVKCYTEDI
ncbi:hypothetical protein F0562_017749 [Nyssa sinensis]|uniref:Ferritin n=1 Tax=Nyssa sinensis TaxID=561372 RepID=A0A5J4ZIN2_9ASTE|nr:hypothetical protein F0562_017749 [Nyssa sinensis]